jgi:subfamily B ATP-binding cassette protein MsbA
MTGIRNTNFAAASAQRKAGGARRERHPLIRVIAYARPWAGLILLSAVLALSLAGTRYARAYLMKPILDEVLLPHQAIAASEGGSRWLPDAPLIGGSRAAESAESPSAGTLTPEQRAEIEAGIRASLEEVLIYAIIIVLGVPVLMLSRSYLVEWVNGRVYIDIVRDVCSKLLALPLGFHHESSRGDILTRTLQDVKSAHRAVKLLLSDFVESAAMVIIGVISLFLISWRLALVSLLIGPAIAGVITFFSTRIKSSARRRQEKAGDVTGQLVDILAGIKIIKAFRAEDNEETAFRRQTKKLFRRTMIVAKNRILAQSLVAMLTNGMAVGMLLLGIFLILDGGFGLTTGDLAAFALMLTTTYTPLRQLSKGWVELMDAQPSAERFCAILDAPGEVPDPPDAVRIDGVHDRIDVRNLSFSYGRESVLENVDFSVRRGEVVAFVGRTGAGKTTLADLLLRFHDPDAGSIEIDGVDLRQISRDSLMGQIAVVTQEPFLFEGTIRDNIRYGKIDSDEEQILAAARAAHVDEFAEALPDRYETEVGSDGVRLSGGQRQRITIARALLKNPAILIFDEATSALDSKSEHLVQDAIDSLLGGRTVFMIAHRLSTIRQANRIIVLESGRVTQNGPHSELVEQPGLYRELVQLQDGSLRGD